MCGPAPRMVPVVSTAGCNRATRYTTQDMSHHTTAKHHTLGAAFTPVICFHSTMRLGGCVPHRAATLLHSWALATTRTACRSSSPTTGIPKSTARGMVTLRLPCRPRCAPTCNLARTRTQLAWLLEACPHDAAAPKQAVAGVAVVSCCGKAVAQQALLGSAGCVQDAEADRGSWWQDHQTGWPASWPWYISSQIVVMRALCHLTRFSARLLEANSDRCI